MHSSPAPGDAVARKFREINDALRRLASDVAGLHARHPAVVLTRAPLDGEESIRVPLPYAATVAALSVYAPSAPAVDLELWVDGAASGAEVALGAFDVSSETGLSVPAPAGSTLSVRCAVTGFGLVASIWF